MMAAHTYNRWADSFGVSADAEDPLPGTPNHRRRNGDAMPCNVAPSPSPPSFSVSDMVLGGSAGDKGTTGCSLEVPFSHGVIPKPAVTPSSATGESLTLPTSRATARAGHESRRLWFFSSEFGLDGDAMGPWVSWAAAVGT